MPLLVVPDTNVFVHFHAFDGLPWREIVGEKDIALLVIGPVLRELDKLKMEPRLRDRMRDVIPRIEALFADGDTSTLREGMPVRFEPAHGLADVMRQHDLEAHIGDDRILAAILRLQGGADRVVLVSDDLGLRLRARSLGLNVVPMPEEHRRAGEDRLEAENARMRRELAELRLASPQLSLRFCEGGELLKLRRGAVPAPGGLNDFEKLRLMPISPERLPQVYEGRLPPTTTQVAEYNAKLEEFHSTFEEYVQRRDEFILFAYQSIPIGLVLANDGGRPANQIKVTLRAPPGVDLINEGDRPTEPTEPEWPLMPALSERSPFEVLDTISQQVRKYDAVYGTGMSYMPRWSWICSGNEASISRTLLSNFEKTPLPQILLAFPSPDDVHGCEILYTIRTHDSPRLVERSLHVVVERPASE